MESRWSESDKLIAGMLKGYGVSAVCKMQLLGGQVITFWKQGNEMGGMPKGIFKNLEVGETVTLDKIIGAELCPSRINGHEITRKS